MIKWLKRKIHRIKCRRFLNKNVNVVVHCDHGLSYPEKYALVSGKMLDRDPKRWFEIMVREDLFRTLSENERNHLTFDLAKEAVDEAFDAYFPKAFGSPKIEDVTINVSISICS